MSNKKKSDPISTLFFLLTLLVIVFSMVVLAPGIIVASLFHVVFSLDIKILWGITLITNFALLGSLYKYGEDRDEAPKMYLILSVTLFSLGVIITLLFRDNLFFNTIKDMYPILF